MKKETSAGICEIEAFDPTRVSKAQKNLIPREKAKWVARGFQALGHPARLKLLDALSSGELCVCDLAQVLDMPVSTVSFHLKELRIAEVVDYRTEGKLAIYFLNTCSWVDYFIDAERRAGKDQ